MPDTHPNHPLPPYYIAIESVVNYYVDTDHHEYILNPIDTSPQQTKQTINTIHAA